MTTREPALQVFLDGHFGKDFEPSAPSAAEVATLNSLVDYVAVMLPQARYVAGLVIDFAVLAQKLSHFDPQAKSARPSLTEATLFEQYELIKSRGKTTANTLTLKYGANQFGIRAIEEEVVDLFRSKLKRPYPSAYVYNTGQWHKYTKQLVEAFRLSESGRFILVNEIAVLILSGLPENRFYLRSETRPRVFEEVIKTFPRQHKGENGGLVFQGIAYGYINADRPHLSLAVDKVRTGSSRQHRFGDIDGYLGLDLEMSVEVKDHLIDSANVESEFGDFARELATGEARGLAFVDTITDDAAEWLWKNRIVPLATREILFGVMTWDYTKQDIALNGVLHYLAHIEQNPLLTEELLKFISGIDPTHTSLAFLRP
jgi:hypothetical protein